MKHAIKLLGVGLALVTAAIAQEDIKDKALLTGSGIDRANDWLVMGDASVTGTNPVLRRVKFSELVNISGMYSTLEPALGNPGTNGYVLSSTTSGTRSWVAPGGTWGSITGTLSSQTDLNTALDAKDSRAPLSPFFASELRRHQTTASIQTLTLLAYGDSMMGGRVDTQLRLLAENRLPTVGYALDALETSVISGTVIEPPANSNANASPTIWDTGRVWKLSTSAVIRIAEISFAPYYGVYSSKATVWCTKQSGGGTATVEYSRDGGSTWAALGTVDTSLASGVAGDPARSEMTMASGVGHHILRITATGGPVNVIGAKMWDAGRSGIIHARSYMGGITVSSTLTAPAAVRNQIGADLGRTVMLYQFRESTDELTQNTLNSFLSAWRTALPVSEIILMDQLDAPLVGTNAATAINNAYYRVASSERVYVKNYPLNDVVGSSAYRDAQGWNSDTIHLSDEAWKHVAADVLRRLTNGADQPVVGQLFTAASGSKEVVFGNQLDGVNSTEFMSRVSRVGKGRFGILSKGATGGRTYLAWNWQPPAATFSDGALLEFWNDGGLRTPITIDNTGYMVFGPYNATTQSGATRGARLVIDEDWNAKACLLLKHSSASATDILKVQNNAGADIFKVNRTGAVTQVPPASVTPAANGDLVIEATSNTSLTLKLKGTDGTVRSVVLTLAP